MESDYEPEPAEVELEEEEELNNSLNRQYEEKVRPCIDLIDSLRALGVEQDLALPAIAVIGDQSSGKSSVLEALSGVALPRGSGIVTRCPLVLKLKKLMGEDAQWEGIVSYQDFEIELQDASEVEKEIRKAQNIIAGEGVGISHELISLQVCSPYVPDLTLIDLPGITRVAVSGQPVDIGYQIKRLIKTYISKEQTIILVVVPCNVDIATTEALSMALEVDPEGDRTIGILTKPDLVDKGTEEKVVDVVHNLVYELKKGYLIVKCRGQQDIQNQLSLAEALQKEEQFFQDHPHFRNLLEEGLATVPCLAEKLSMELNNHICKSMPLLESQIKEKHEEISEELRKCGTAVPEDQSEKTLFLIEKLSTFNQEIQKLVEGEEEVTDVRSGRLFTKVRNRFNEWNLLIEKNFKTSHIELQKKVNLFENLYRGRELPGFVNYKTFEIIIREQIRQLEEPALKMLQEITEMVRTSFVNIATKNFEELFNLLKTSKVKLEDLKVEQEEEAKRIIQLHFQMEQIVYCQDHVYRGTLRNIRKEEEENRGGQSHHMSQTPTKFKNLVSASPTASMDEIIEHLSAYQEEVSRRLCNHIPLIIQFFMLWTLARHLRDAMLQLLQDKEGCNNLLLERPSTSNKRKVLKEQLARLTKARHRVSQFSA
ncbi:interferon-induced GTP-binding protein Mx1 [Suncus etruscus]|uniref:interferon-induced GTP-binding protein Mx1 n=1 Tax=Suncus etruscus TaxID=109475 RepID=UPI002110B0D6|nr:interferon-induced GTP-binding protein Mx1 [Suncus etruscus]